MRVSFWLIPAEPVRTELSQQIAELARCYGAPSFVPHVTIYSGPLLRNDNPEELLTRVAGQGSEMVLQCTGISHSDVFTKTLFLEFAQHPALTELAGAFRRGCMGQVEYELRPHLSLVYAPIPASERQRLAPRVSLPEQITFDTLDAIISGDATRNAEDVRRWRMIGERQLRGTQPGKCRA